MNKVTWGHPTKSLRRAQRRLARDLKFYSETGNGNCARLGERHPRIISRKHKDGTVWFHTLVDDIPLMREVEDAPSITITREEYFRAIGEADPLKQ